jgi:hypothetical protein
MKYLTTLLLVFAASSGCTSTSSQTPRTALIGHIVFVELADPGDYAEILADSDAMLASIPSVITYAAGQHIDTGRSTIINDYDLAIYLGFDTIDGLGEYVTHDQHVAYVTKWKPRLKALRVYDMHDSTK